MIKIYTLKHPITNEIRYIGKTSKKLKERLACHISDAKVRRYKNHNSNWIFSLLVQKIEPIIELLDEVDDENWILFEQYWISQFKSWGFRLTNLCSGGKGGIGNIPSKETIELRASKLRGIPCSKESKEKISKANKGKPKSLSHINNTRLGIIKLQGKPILQYSLNNEFIKEWSYMKEASIFYNVDQSSIMRCCQGIFKKSCGFIWKYKS